ncbi:MAG: winged helix-turn-helix domain-containing protein, partial [Acidobacteriaceae bacterium]|nr:winged helix-turn-helix domain-containing protein [Acidobacteriaceae bacterium]
MYSSRRIFRFGAFELRTETGELTKQGTRIRLQTKPLLVLEALLERPGELITRDELCNKLWPEGTFVDFESGLNTATNRLRSALGDSAEAPRYIETLPRLGYRFICPVTEVLNADLPRVLPMATMEPGTLDVQAAAAPEPDAHFEVAPSPGIVAVKNSSASLYTAGSVAQLLTVLVAVLLLLLVFGFLHSKANTNPHQAAFRQLTFRPGIIGSARFAPDSKSIVYSANWGAATRQTYLLNLTALNARPLDFASGALLSVSRKGELALASPDPLGLGSGLELSTVPLRGGAPTIIAEKTKAADWSPDGSHLALVRQNESGSVVEFPAGNAVYTSNGWINCLRVSPRGDQVAFFDHPVRDDTAGYLRIVDRKRRTRLLTAEWSNADGLAWSPSGREVWFTASKAGTRSVLYAVSERSRLRQISDTPSSLRLLDISNTGRALIATDDTRMTMIAALAGAGETDLSKFDCSHVDDISSDGNLVLFTEGGDAGGQHYIAYLHNHISGKTYPINSGRGLAISADGKSVLTIDPLDRGTLMITSVDSRKVSKIFGRGFEYQWAKFLGSGE